MNATMEPRLVKIHSANGNAIALPSQNKIATRFLAALLACLSAWGT